MIDNPPIDLIKEYAYFASGGSVTEPVNGSWIQAIAVYKGATGPVNGSWLQALCIQFGVTSPINGSWEQALAVEEYGVSAPINNSWWWAMIESGPVGTAPVNTVAPVLSGTTEVGQTLTSTTGTWTGTSPITYSYVFIGSFDGVNFTVLQSSFSNTYVLQPADFGMTVVRCNVYAQNAFGLVLAATNDVGPITGQPVNTVAPTMSGINIVSRTLTSTNGTWTGTSPITYSYQWQRSTDGGTNFSNISGATNNTYVLQSADSSFIVRCRVTASNGVGTAQTVSTNSMTIINTLLDTYSNGILAYHLRLQRGAYYGGNIVEIVRTNDGATLNIGHDTSGEVDIATAITHAGTQVNRIVQSQTFTNAVWTFPSNQASIVSTNNVAPDSTNTASTFQLSGQFGSIQQTEAASGLPTTNNVNPTGNYCLSAYVKKVNRNEIRLVPGTGTFYLFNYDSPAANPSIGANFQDVGNGWYRIWVVATGAQMSYMRLQGGNSSASGDQHLIWGVQINPGTTPLTYFPTTTVPLGSCRIRTYYDHSTNARHAVNSTASRQDYLVVDGMSVIENGQIVAARGGLIGGSASYSLTSITLPAAVTIYDKHRFISQQNTTIGSPYYYIHRGGNGVGFRDPGTYNNSLFPTTLYSTVVWNKNTPNGTAYRRNIVAGTWDTGTTLTNLTQTTQATTTLWGDFFNTWGEGEERGVVVYSGSHDVSTMQAIAAAI